MLSGDGHHQLVHVGDRVSAEYGEGVSADAVEVEGGGVGDPNRTVAGDGERVGLRRGSVCGNDYCGDDVVAEVQADWTGGRAGGDRDAVYCDCCAGFCCGGRHGNGVAAGRRGGRVDFIIAGESGGERTGAGDQAGERRVALREGYCDGGEERQDRYESGGEGWSGSFGDVHVFRMTGAMMKVKRFHGADSDGAAGGAPGKGRGESPGPAMRRAGWRRLEAMLKAPVD